MHHPENQKRECEEDPEREDSEVSEDVEECFSKVEDLELYEAEESSESGERSRVLLERGALVSLANSSSFRMGSRALDNGPPESHQSSDSGED